MMQLDKERARIILEEGVWVDTHLTQMAPAVKPSFWEARLEGYTLGEGAEICMERYAGTPEEALRLLFEAMHESGVTL